MVETFHFVYREMRRGSFMSKKDLNNTGESMNPGGARVEDSAAHNS